MSDSKSPPTKQAPAEIIARALSIAYHKHLLATSLWQKREPDAKFAIKALREAGYVIVPVEPTEAMIDAGWRRIECREDAGENWRLMVEAAGE